MSCCHVLQIFFSILIIDEICVCIFKGANYILNKNRDIIQNNKFCVPYYKYNVKYNSPIYLRVFNFLPVEVTKVVKSYSKLN